MKKSAGSSPKAVVLLSGGIDSSVTLYLAIRQYGYRCVALIFDYNQRHRRELISAKKIAKLSKVPYYVMKISFPWGGSALTDERIKVPHKKKLSGSHQIPITYVPARNIIFLSFAFSLAEVAGADKIFIGAHTEDYSGYPDCRPEFLRSFQKSCNLGMKRKNIEVIAPLIGLNKAEIIKKGGELGVPFEYTWSCYQGGEKPCLHCDSCLYRQRGFKKAGREDPLLLKKDRGARRR